ncbi:MAG: FAD-binding protein [Myxococcales bacterium]|nr:MAG: FAD-binding protein [Myxococcales bacterium]
MANVSRRSMLAGMAAGVAVVGFDPVQRSWVTEAQAAPPGTIALPNLDGQLVTDAPALGEASQDFGYIISRTPVAVLKPGSAQDILKLVKYANKHGIKVAGRGEAHSTYGQAQAQGGVVIDMRLLSDIGTPTASGVWVEAGATWRAVLAATTDAGLTPPVFTDYTDTTVGGTLSVGGIGGASHRHGLQIDNVLALDIVTGDGRAVTCSPTQQPLLFRSVLGGLGQFAIIVRAKLKLIAAPTHVRVFRITYTDVTRFVADQKKCALDERFSYLEGSLVADGAGGWTYQFEAAAYYKPNNPPDNAALLAGLLPGAVIEETSYTAWITRIDAQVDFLKSVGAWTIPHPWFDIFLPGSKAAAYVGDVASELTLDQTGNGPVLFYAFRRSKLTSLSFQAPNEEVCFIFDILRFTPPVPEIVAQRIAENRDLFEQARAVGGKRYPISAIPFSQVDWVQHFGIDWFVFVLQKLRFDERNVLTPGQGIFTS